MKNNLFTLVIIFIFLSCKNDVKSESYNKETTIIDAEKNNDSLKLNMDSIKKIKNDSIQIHLQKKAEEAKKSNKKQIFNGAEYAYWPIKNSDSLKKMFNTKFSKEEKYLIAALNRIDTKHINSKDTLIVPLQLKKSLMDYTPFPTEVSILKEVDKLAIFSYPLQAYAIYENGKLVKWGPTNMGKKASQTPRGLFFTNWKGRQVKSTVDSEWILNWNFNISNKGGVGWHQYEMPGYPASHSCLRLLEADAKWLFNWADQWILENSNTVKVKGTPVIVYGDYTFGKKGIWHKLPINSSITNVSISEMEQIVNKHIPEILKQQNIRKEYNAQKAEQLTTISKDSLK